MSVELTLFILSVLLLLLLFTRILFSTCVNLLRRKVLRRRSLPTEDLPYASTVLAVLGSGGHTAEMLNIVSDIAIESCKISYVISGGDQTSEARARALHSRGSSLGKVKIDFFTLPRARYVGETFVSAAPRAALATLSAVPLLLRCRPQVLLCNGPGTSAVIALVAVVLNATGMLNTRIVYAESVARVRSLSLSGKLLYPFAHRFLVQWPQLKQQYQMVEYHGRYS